LLKVSVALGGVPGSLAPTQHAQTTLRCVRSLIGQCGGFTAAATAAIVDPGGRCAARRSAMQISARNQLRGTVQKITLGTVMAEVVINVGDQEIVAAITRGSVESLGLKLGDQVVAIVKATEVMVGKP
jgi:molybdopterin-binding protein